MSTATEVEEVLRNMDEGDETSFEEEIENGNIKGIYQTTWDATAFIEVPEGELRDVLKAVLKARGYEITHHGGDVEINDPERGNQKLYTMDSDEGIIVRR